MMVSLTPCLLSVSATALPLLDLPFHSSPLHSSSAQHAIAPHHSWPRPTIPQSHLLPAIPTPGCSAHAGRRGGSYPLLPSSAWYRSREKRRREFGPSVDLRRLVKRVGGRRGGGGYRGRRGEIRGCTAPSRGSLSRGALWGGRSVPSQLTVLSDLLLHYSCPPRRMTRSIVPS